MERRWSGGHLRALNFSSLRDTETIENNRRESPI